MNQVTKEIGGYEWKKVTLRATKNNRMKKKISHIYINATSLMNAWSTFARMPSNLTRPKSLCKAKYRLIDVSPDKSKIKKHETGMSI